MPTAGKLAMVTNQGCRLCVCAQVYSNTHTNTTGGSTPTAGWGGREENETEEGYTQTLENL